jgi:uncharacterized membrane protein
MNTTLTEVRSIDTHPSFARASARVQSQMRYRSLDALRGVAALVVVLGHSMITLPIWSDVVFHGVRNSKLTLILGTPPLDVL